MLFTNINSRCDGQSNQGLVLHDDMLACGHWDQVLNSTRLCNSANNFLCGRKNKRWMSEITNKLRVGMCPGTDWAAAVSDESCQQATGFPFHSPMLFCFTPVHDLSQQHRVSAQHQRRLLCQWHKRQEICINTAGGKHGDTSVSTWVISFSSGLNVHQLNHWNEANETNCKLNMIQHAVTSPGPLFCLNN